MNRWNKFIFNWLIEPCNFTDESGGVGEAAVTYDRRSGDTITKEMIRDKAHNGYNQREQIAEIALQNERDHGEMKGDLKVVKDKVRWHDKFFLAIVTGAVITIVGGFVTLFIWLAQRFLGG